MEKSMLWIQAVSAIAAAAAAFFAFCAAKEAKQSVCEMQNQLAYNQLHLAMQLLCRTDSTGARKSILAKCDEDNNGFDDLANEVDEVCRSFNFAFVLVENTAAEEKIVKEWGRQASTIWACLESFIQEARRVREQPDLWHGLEKMAKQWDELIKQ